MKPHRSIPKLWPLVVVLSVAGCDHFPPPDPLPSQYTTCAVATDCVVTELGCCDACNGGLAVTVRADQEAEVIRLYAENCPGSTACTEMGCPPPVVDCVAGTCTASEGSFE